MISLLLAVICSASITLVLKVGAKHCDNRYVMLSSNYITCVIMALLFMPREQIFSISEHGFLVLLLGVINGILFLVCMVYNQINVKKNGAILTATFVRLGIMVPTLLSIFLFGEIPSRMQVVGILIVAVAFVIMGKGQKKDVASISKATLGSLIALMLLGGVTDSMSKVFEQTCPMELDDIYLLVTFGVAFVICAGITCYKRERVGVKDCVMGVAMGIPNYLSTLFLIKAISTVPAFVVYPSFSVGSILVVILVSVLCFKEKLEKMQVVSLILIISALILLNVS